MSSLSTPLLGDVDADIINETNIALASMVDDFKDINAMIHQAHDMALEQQTGLDDVETNLSSVNSNVDEAIEELEEARALRRQCCGCCGCPPCCTVL
jgi:methyl-accepting chemotaxis protein